MKYGLIGEHLSHSFSKLIHERIADYKYEIKEIEKENIVSFIKDKDFLGINVTIPYKETVIPYLDEITDSAKKIGAVNVIVNKDGKLYGDNTDYLGMKALADKLGIDFKDKKVLILGTGGTSKTAMALVTDSLAKEVYRVSRSEKDNSITYDNVYENHTDADIIINTTPCGMYPNVDACPIDISRFNNLSGVIDAIYNPLKSVLVRQAQKSGIPAEGGLYMLVAQAVYASEIFINTKYETKVIDDVFCDVFNRQRNIVLIGMPQSGKSTIGKLLAKKLDKEFIDTDEEIVKYEGKPITDIFKDSGVKRFRTVETEVIKEVSVLNNKVISTGGGAILKEENIYYLKQNGVVFFLDRLIDQLTPTDDRPLADTADKLISLFKERYPIYKERCDYRIVNNTSAENAGNKIIKLLNNEKKILVVNGPNLNMLGIREPDIYGYETYNQLCKRLEKYANDNKIEIECYQSNHEGDLVDKIQSAYGEFDGIVINPGGYTHTSVAILDAVKAVSIPTVEVHISKVDEREDFRQVSYIRKGSKKTIAGHGTEGYFEAIDFLVNGE